MDDGTDCKASLKFGTACFKSNAEFFGMVFHELEHNTNQSSLEVDEGRCDWASFKMFKLVAGDDRKLFDTLCREYANATFYRQESDLAYNKLPGVSGDSHSTARAFSQSLIEAMESRECELYDYVDMVYDSWANASEIKMPMTTNIKVGGLDFKIFTDHFLPELNKRLEGTGVQLDVYSEIEALRDEKDDTAKKAKLRDIIDRLDVAVNKVDPTLTPIGNMASDEELLAMLNSSTSNSLARAVKNRMELLLRERIKFAPGFEGKKIGDSANKEINYPGVFTFIPKVCLKNK